MENEAATLGLKLNCSKTELVSSDVGAQNSILSIVSELKVVPCSQVSLLGIYSGSHWEPRAPGQHHCSQDQEAAANGYEAE